MFLDTLIYSPLFIMKKVLLIQFRDNLEIIHHEQLCLRKYLPPNIKMEVLNILDERIFWTKPDQLLISYGAVLLGGSSFNLSENNHSVKKVIKNIQPLIHFLFEKDFPTLGICFGHQLLGYFLKEKVANDPHQAETGTFNVYLTNKGLKSRIFQDIPGVFLAQFGHKDSLENLPPRTTLLARTDRCLVASFQYKDNIYGVQFHPELDDQSIIFRLKKAPEYCQGKPGEALKQIQPSPYSHKVIENFVSFTI